MGPFRGEQRDSNPGPHLTLPKTGPHLWSLGAPSTAPPKAAQELTRSVRTSGLGCTSAGLGAPRGSGAVHGVYHFPNIFQRGGSVPFGLMIYIEAHVRGRT